MGATTKSITGLFANFCGRNVSDRNTCEHFVAGYGIRSAAAQGYLSLSSSHLNRLAYVIVPGYTRPNDSWRDQVRDQARWLLKRVGGWLASALPSMQGLLPHRSAGIGSAWYPAHCRPQTLGLHAVGRQQTGVRRLQG